MILFFIPSAKGRRPLTTWCKCGYETSIPFAAQLKVFPLLFKNAVSVCISFGVSMTFTLLNGSRYIKKFQDLILSTELYCV